MSTHAQCGCSGEPALQTLRTSGAPHFMVLCPACRLCTPMTDTEEAAWLLWDIALTCGPWGGDRADGQGKGGS